MNSSSAGGSANCVSTYVSAVRSSVPQWLPAASGTSIHLVDKPPATAPPGSAARRRIIVPP